MNGAVKSKTPMMITRYAIDRYAKSVDNHNPVYYDAQAAVEAGYEKLIAPSCFFGQLSFSKIILGQEAYIPTGSVHIKQKYKFCGPVKEGDKITVELSSVTRKDEKNRDILEYHINFINQDGAVVCRSIMVNMLNPA